jgi:hypothetical protein
LVGNPPLITLLRDAMVVVDIALHNKPREGGAALPVAARIRRRMVARVEEEKEEEEDQWNIASCGLVLDAAVVVLLLARALFFWVRLLFFLLLVVVHAPWWRCLSACVSICRSVGCFNIPLFLCADRLNL